ncbi:Rh158.2 [macacine betaherpesvirus 3]|nr:Rh158.2 [macacine betaherpesvirus 3]
MEHGFSKKLVPATLLMLLLIGRISSDIEVLERCYCLQTTQGISAKNIKSVELKEPRDACPKLEVIATLKNGLEVCLNPDAPMVKKIVKRIRDYESKQIKQLQQ